MQWPNISLDAKSMTLVTILAHSSGEWYQGKIMLPAVGRDGFSAQSCGTAITYARRYTYAAITGCAAEDDDANSASGRGTSEAAQKVGEAKIEALKAKKGQQDPSRGPDQLCVLQVGENYEVSGDPEIMNNHKELLLGLGKRQGKSVIMTADSLDAFKFQFVEQRGGILTALKAAKQ
jgi:hypothetical protein